MIWLAEEVHTSGKGVIVYKNARKEKKKKECTEPNAVIQNEIRAIIQVRQHTVGSQRKEQLILTKWL